MLNNNFKLQREQLVFILKDRIKNQAVLYAIGKVPRHLFVSDHLHYAAYDDSPLPIGFEQVITQPYLVARMTELALGKQQHIQKVLEIGTGSGYQAAILAELANEVYTVERIKKLLDQAKKRFALLHYNNIHTLLGDGRLGWAKNSPYDAIIVTAVTNEPPESLLEQMANNGRMVIPIGNSATDHVLQLIIRKGKKYLKKWYDPVRFVPLLSGVVFK